MSVGSHLQIRLEEYDSRIRTFIPAYEQLLEAAAQALCGLDTRTPHIVDLGTGTGALSAVCLRRFPGARITGIDADDGILDMARQRLAAQGSLASFVQSSFLDLALPTCDAIVASLALIASGSCIATAVGRLARAGCSSRLIAIRRRIPRWRRLAGKHGVSTCV